MPNSCPWKNRATSFARGSATSRCAWARMSAFVRSLPAAACVEELLIGRRAPEKVGETRGHLVRCRPHQGGVSVHRLAELDPVQELRRLQDPLDDGARAGREISGHATHAVDRAEGGGLARLQGSTERLEAEIGNELAAASRFVERRRAAGERRRRGAVGRDLQGDRVRNHAVPVDQQAGHPERVGGVPEPVADLLARERVGRSGRDLENVADGVVVLEPRQPAHRGARRHGLRAVELHGGARASGSPPGAAPDDPPLLPAALLPAPVVGGAPPGGTPVAPVPLGPPPPAEGSCPCSRDLRASKLRRGCVGSPSCQPSVALLREEGAFC